MPSPLCNIDAVSTQTLSPSPTSLISRIFAGFMSKLLVPRYTIASLTSLIEDVLNITPSTPTSKIENIFLTSSGVLAIAKIFVCILCNFAIMFSRGMIFQSLTSMITKSNPFFEIDNTLSISAFDNTSNLIPIFFPFGLVEFSFSSTT